LRKRLALLAAVLVVLAAVTMAAVYAWR